MQRRVCLALAVACAVMAAAQATAPAGAAGPGTVPVGRIEGVINAGTARYVGRVIREAERSGAPAAVLTLDSAAGYESATRRVVERIEGAAVPVLVFVSPNGARAEGAGRIVLDAADLGAMAPATSLSPSLGATEALRQGIVDEVAGDVPDLLVKVDGRRLPGPWSPLPLATRGLSAEPVPRDWLEGALDVIVDPNLAYLLLVLGLYGVVVELSAPGVTAPGVAGGAALLLALFAFTNLPVNWLGVALIAVAAGLVFAEVQLPSHGLLTLAGVGTLIAGSVLLYRPPGGVPSPYGPTVGLDPWLVVVLVSATAVGFGWLVRQSVMARRRPPDNAPPGAGEVGIAGPVVDATGTVQLAGQTWSAEWAKGTSLPGQRVRVVGRRGLTLIVEPDDDPQDEAREPRQIS